MELRIINRLSTLGHPKRLALFRLLMRRYPDSVPASELALALSLKPNTLSSYVKAMLQAGLLTQKRVGTSLRYAVHMDSVRETFDYLLHDCCRGRPELCATLPPIGQTQGKYNVLFVCTGNSARSIMAEAILREEAGDRFNAFSAGTNPRSEINPFALGVLKQRGYDTAGLKAKNLSVFQRQNAPDFNFIFTVCNHVANEECPSWMGKPVSAHWGIPDPSKIEGTQMDEGLPFRQTYDALSSRIRAFTDLPLESLDRIATQRAVDAIATTPKGNAA